MTEIKVVKSPKRGPQNQKVKNFKLAVRNFANKVTGQDALITEYNSAILALADASDATKSVEMKKKILAVIHQIEGGETVTDGIATWDQGGFNPYTPFQKKALRQKIAMMRAAMKEVGIKR